MPCRNLNDLLAFVTVAREGSFTRVAALLGAYPDVALEFDVNYGLRDIVADRFDAGVRFGHIIDKDMTAIPIGPPLRMAVVASPLGRPVRVGLRAPGPQAERANR